MGMDKISLDMDKAEKSDKKDKIELKTFMESKAVAEYLIALAKGFELGRITVEKDAQKLVLTPAENAEVEVSARIKKDKAKFSLEVSWRTSVAEPQALKISTSASKAATLEIGGKNAKKEDKKDEKKIEAKKPEAKKSAPKKAAKPAAKKPLAKPAPKAAAPAFGKPPVKPEAKLPEVKKPMPVHTEVKPAAPAAPAAHGLSKPAAPAAPHAPGIAKPEFKK